MTELKRVISLPMLVLYGLGNMVGAGFYALTGKVAGLALYHTPLAFLISALVAFFSAVSFAELCSRFPVCAGPSEYVHKAFGKRGISGLTGWLVVVTGVVSAATISTAFQHFLEGCIALPSALVISLFVVLLGAISIWGIGESVLVVNLIGAVTIAGLFYVAGAGATTLAQEPDRLALLFTLPEAGAWQGIMAGAFLSFYAYIGFEDLVCNAEEIVNVKKTIGRGIFLSLFFTLVIYVLVGSLAVLSMEPTRLSQAANPMAALVSDSASGAAIVTFISLIAGVNGALVQIVMASRMTYGMATQGRAPAWFGKVEERTQTPVRATVFVTLIVLALALVFPMVGLASTTSFVMLTVFALVNISLLVIKLRDRKSGVSDTEHLSYPILFPVVGALSCVYLLFNQLIYSGSCNLHF